MAFTSFILARRPVQSSNQSNPILTVYPLPRLKKDETRLWRRQILLSCLPALAFGLTSKRSAPPLHAIPLFHSLFFPLTCSAHSGLSLICVCILVTYVVEEIHGEGIRPSDLFFWDLNQTRAWRLPCDLTAHSASNSIALRCICSKRGHVPNDRTHSYWSLKYHL